MFSVHSAEEALAVARDMCQRHTGLLTNTRNGTETARDAALRIILAEAARPGSTTPRRTTRGGGGGGGGDSSPPFPNGGSGARGNAYSYNNNRDGLPLSPIVGVGGGRRASHSPARGFNNYNNNSSSQNNFFSPPSRGGGGGGIGGMGDLTQVESVYIGDDNENKNNNNSSSNQQQSPSFSLRQQRRGSSQGGGGGLNNNNNNFSSGASFTSSAGGGGSHTSRRTRGPAGKSFECFYCNEPSSRFCKETGRRHETANDKAVRQWRRIYRQLAMAGTFVSAARLAKVNTCVEEYAIELNLDDI